MRYVDPKFLPGKDSTDFQAKSHAWFSPSTNRTYEGRFLIEPSCYLNGAYIVYADYYILPPMAEIKAHTTLSGRGIISRFFEK